MNFNLLLKDKLNIYIVVSCIVFCILLILVFYFYYDVENLLESNQLQLAIQRSKTTSVALVYCLICFYFLEVLIFFVLNKHVIHPAQGINSFNPLYFYGIFLTLFFFGWAVTAILPSQKDLIKMHSTRINGKMIFCKVLAASHFKHFTGGYEIQENSDCNHDEMFIVVNSPNKKLIENKSYDNKYARSNWILNHADFRLKVPALKGLNPQLVYTLALHNVQCGHTPKPDQYIRLGYDSVLNRIFKLDYEDAEESIVKIYNKPIK